MKILNAFLIFVLSIGNCFAQIPGEYVVGSGYATIQAAVDAAHAAGGGIVRVPHGTYTVTSSVQMYDNVHLIGQGPQSTVIKKTSGSFNLINMGVPGNYSTRNDRGSVQDLELSFSGTLDGACISMTHTHYSIIKNVRTDHCDYGIKMDYSWSNSVHDTEINDSGTRGLLIANNSNYENFYHVFASSGSRTPPYQIEIDNSDVINFYGLANEGGWTGAALYAHNKTENVLVSGWYVEENIASGAGNYIALIGGGNDTVSTNINIDSGWIWFPSTGTNKIAAFRIKDNVKNVSIKNLHIQNEGAAWQGKFFDIGTGSNTTEDITIEGNSLSSPSQSPMAFNVASNVKGFNQKNNNQAPLFPSVNNSTLYTIENASSILTDKNVGIGTSAATEKLTVSGAVKANKIIVSGGSDNLTISGSNINQLTMFGDGNDGLTLGTSSNGPRMSFGAGGGGSITMTPGSMFTVNGNMKVLSSISPVTVKTGIDTPCNQTCAGSMCIWAWDKDNIEPVDCASAFADKCGCFGP